jgi:hypothetical protein
MALQALRTMGVIRTVNNPVADYGEWLVAKAFKGRLLPSSSKGIDVVSARMKLQVKVRWMAKGKGDSRLLGAIRCLDSATFTHVAALLLGVDFQVQEAYLIPHSVVREWAKWSKHVNAHRLHLGKGLCTDRRVKNITSMFAWK